MTPPEQTMRALALGNELRLKRASIKKQIRRGQLSAAEALEDPIVRRGGKDRSTGMTIGELLRAQDRWGRVRAVKFLGHFAISENRPIATLTDRQRTVLAEALTR